MWNRNLRLYSEEECEFGLRRLMTMCLQNRAIVNADVAEQTVFGGQLPL